MDSGSKQAGGQRGFTYLFVLFLVAGLGFLLVAATELWQTSLRREREQDLLFAGAQYRDAIGRYYLASPGLQQYPQSLDELLVDKRFPQIRRHLRKLYRDPVTGSKEWGILREQGRIIGVFSLSPERPFKQANFSRADADFAQRAKYSEWQFVFQPAEQAGNVAGSSQKSAATPVAASPIKGNPTGEELKQTLELVPDPQHAACAAEHVASLRRCAALPLGDAQSCFADAAQRSADCLSAIRGDRR